MTRSLLRLLPERAPNGSSSSDDVVTLSEFQPLSEDAVRKMAVAVAGVKQGCNMSGLLFLLLTG